VTTTASLLGARVRRIDAPSADLWAITLVAAEVRGTLIISLQPGATGVGWSEKRPHGMPATSFVLKCRKELEGGRLLGLEEVGSRCELSIGRADQKLRLAFDFARQNILLYGAEALIASAHKEATRSTAPEPSSSRAAAQGDAASIPAHTTHGGAASALDAATSATPRESVDAPPDADDSDRVARIAIDIPLDELMLRARTLLEERGEALLSLRKAALARGLKTARKKLSRKLDAIAGDAARAADAPTLRQRAQLLLSNLHAIPRGAATVRVLDYNLDPPAEVDIALDPAQTPREIAEGWFKRARRFERGATVAAERAATGQQELAVLEAIGREIEACTTVEALDALAIKAERLGIKSDFSTQPTAPKSREPQKRVPYRILLGSGDRQILVGKGAADNDVLTRDHARSHDLWLHARDVAGAHVVVPLEKGEVCPQDLLIDAAHAAAHFSESRGETTVDVSYTPRRYVRKPKGSPPGLVVLDREKVLRLQLEAARLARLLQSERQ
jgi:predicted ribosome quality control (RQC) complex YloA/Tae2 family protein